MNGMISARQSSFDAKNQPSKKVAAVRPTKMEKCLKLSSKTKRSFQKYFKEYTGNEINYFRVDNLLNRIHLEGLIIHDKNDQVVDIASAHKLKTIWPNAQLSITKGKGHKLRDNAIVKQVCDFISRENI